MTIYRMEMKRNFKSFIIWTISVCGMLFFGMMFYPAINTGDLLVQIEPIFETPMLKGMLSAFGGADLTSLGNLGGFYVTYNSFYNILLGCIFASVLAGNLLAKEEAEKTAEFLFTRPVTRFSIFISKVSVMLTYITVLGILFFLTGIVSMELVKETAPRRLEISKSHRELLARQVSANPELIYKAFNLDEDSFAEYSLGYASDMINKNESELNEMNLDISDMNNLLFEAMQSPEAFFESAIDNPEKYMEMFSMKPEQKGEFLQNIQTEQEEYYRMKKSFYSSPELFLQFIRENPGLALNQFARAPGAMKEAVKLLELPEDFEKRIFKKYNIRKLAVMCLYIVLLFFCTGSLVMFVSLLIRRGRSVLGVAIGFVLFFYFLKSITGLAAGFSGAAEILGFLSPFSWVDTDINSLDYGLSWWRIVLFLAVSAAALTASGLRLNRKDILV